MLIKDEVTNEELLEIMQINERELARCISCMNPMYCIYQTGVRDFCHECELQMKIDNAKEILKKRNGK